MLSSKEYIESKAKLSGKGRFQYLQALVTEFQDTDKDDAKLQILANLGNFAYDPINYESLRQLNVIELFLDMLTEDDEKMVAFGIGGICNSCIDTANMKIILENNGIEAVIGCLSSSNEETVLNAITTLMFLVTPQSKAEITSTSVVDYMKKMCQSSNVRLRNLSSIFLQDYCDISVESAKE